MESGLSTAGHSRALVDVIRHQLEATRARTLELIALLDEEHLRAQPSELLSPLVVDLAELASFEERWLVRALGGAPLPQPCTESLHDGLGTAHAALGPHEALVYLAEVRRRSLELLDSVSLEASNPLLAQGFVYGMVLQHEQQRIEAMLAAIQAMDVPYPAAPETAHRLLKAVEPGMSYFPGGELLRGSDHGFALDNERPLHRVPVRPFLLDRHPVTNAQYLAFIDDSGYERSELWSQTGYAFVRREALELPLYWLRDGEGCYFRRRFGRIERLPLQEPVQHVSYFEAEAYARWAGKRLPSESEWELAATFAPMDAGNLWRDGMKSPFAPVPVGSLPQSATLEGVEQLFGDVWEWTSSHFEAYPGFRAVAAEPGSAAGFGQNLRVLRGGSWATHPLAVRASYRGSEFPLRRHLFAGLRCAQGAQG